MRSHYCGDLRPEHVGSTVTCCGWVGSRREHGEHLAFVDLRDHTGVVQCVVDHAHDLRPEYVLRVSGTVKARPEGTVNRNLATGEVELGDCEVEVLSTAQPPPFPVSDRADPDEAVRLRYRYVDLRRSRMQANLRVRAKVNAALRESLQAAGYLEVETPMLVGPTPEGARDFVVPSRLQPGSFYALPQSPQLFKQLCMVGGIDRYFQIARCLRDEDLRADRQFEFMQLDLEASFVGQDEVMDTVSEAVSHASEVVTGRRPAPIGQMSWTEAMERYGTDKPDIRFGMELEDLTGNFETTEFKAFRAPCVKGIRLEAGAALGRSRLDALVERAKQFGAKGLVWMRVGEGRSLESPVSRFLTEQERVGTALALGAAPGDLLLLVADERPVVRRVLGLLRLELGRPPVNEGGLSYLWVTAFPLFEGLDDNGSPVPAHHPFTMPHPDDLDRLESDPLAVRSLAYDLVLNGWELGSGSVRIHRPDVQERVFSVLGIDPEQARSRFGFLLDAFTYGAPPHAGFAFGIDRLVALLVGEENIREVIAFPKTQSGTDPLTGSPSPLDEAHLAELGIRLAPPPSTGGRSPEGRG